MGSNEVRETLGNRAFAYAGWGQRGKFGEASKRRGGRNANWSKECVGKPSLHNTYLPVDRERRWVIVGGHF